MRLLVLSDGDNPHTIKWVRALAARGHEIALYSFQQVSAGTYAGLHRVEVHSMGLRNELIRSAEGGLRKVRYLLGIPVVRRLAAEFKPDLVHAHYVSSYGLVADLANIGPRLVSVWGGDVYTAVQKSRLHRYLVQRVLRRADTVLSTSHVMREQVGRLVDRDAIVTPFGVDTGVFRPLARPRPSDAITIGIVKSLEPKYGVDILIRAFAKARINSTANLKLLIVGDGSMRQKLRELAETLGVDSQLEFVGRVPPDEVAQFHQRMDIAAYPSVEDSESFGVSVVEAQACGIPVVVSRVGGLPEVVVEGVTGLVVEPRSVEGLEHALRQLIEDAALRLRMGLAGRQHVVSNYDLSESVGKMELAYKLTLQQRAERRLHNLDSDR